MTNVTRVWTYARCCSFLTPRSHRSNKYLTVCICDLEACWPENYTPVIHDIPFPFDTPYGCGLTESLRKHYVEFFVSQLCCSYALIGPRCTVATGKIHTYIAERRMQTEEQSEYKQSDYNLRAAFKLEVTALSQSQLSETFVMHEIYCSGFVHDDRSESRKTARRALV